MGKVKKQDTCLLIVPPLEVGWLLTLTQPLPFHCNYTGKAGPCRQHDEMMALFSGARHFFGFGPFSLSITYKKIEKCLYVESGISVKIERTVKVELYAFLEPESQRRRRLFQLFCLFFLFNSSRAGGGYSE